MSENLKVVRYDKTHASLATGLTGLIDKLKHIDIEAEGIEFEIQKMAAKSREARDIAKDRCVRELKPYQPQVILIKGRWRPLVEGFDELFRRLKSLGSDVLRQKRAEQERIRRAAQKKLLAAQVAEKRASTKKAVTKLAESTKELKAAVDSLPPEGAPLGVKTEEGTLYARKVWKWETVDVKKVPNTYVQRNVDTKKVDLAVKNGKREITGIKIWEEEEMVARRRT